MVSNIVIIGLNRIVSKQVAEILSEQLQMHYLDTIELFEFDNIPRTFSQILEMNGERYFRKKEKSLNKYVASFENTVIHVESGSVLKKKNIENLKENCVVVYLHYPVSKIKQHLKKQEYKSIELKRFFCINEKRIKRRIELLKQRTNIVINANGKSVLRLASDILRAFEGYFHK